MAALVDRVAWISSQRLARLRSIETHDYAYVYFDPVTRAFAERLRETIVSKFVLEPGGFSDEPRGPYPISQFNVIFQGEEFQGEEF